MRISEILIFIVFLVVSLSGCKKNDDTDQTPPTIDISAIDAFPKHCDTLYRGETFTFIATFTDNEGLGSYSLDIHNNFDHHSHTTELQECELWPVQTPINPYFLIEGYEIPNAPQTITTHLEITIPIDIDQGDYHFMIRVVDVNGWQDMKGLSIKIL
ncbi:MAG: hypothetical protein C0599_11280 [Salinivirgaceae bacterium]|nr:MAG: hypothetical protein C0599_11280 [Salinivirgaceae bacterium]